VIQFSLIFKTNIFDFAYVNKSKGFLHFPLCFIKVQAFHIFRLETRVHHVLTQYIPGTITDLKQSEIDPVV